MCNPSNSVSLGVSNNSYAEDDETMSTNGLRLFLEKDQSVREATSDFAADLIHRFEPSPNKKMGRMTLAGNSTLKHVKHDQPYELDSL